MSDASASIVLPSDSHSEGATQDDVKEEHIHVQHTNAHISTHRSSNDGSNDDDDDVGIIGSESDDFDISSSESVSEMGMYVCMYI